MKKSNKKRRGLICSPTSGYSIMVTKIKSIYQINTIEEKLNYLERTVLSCVYERKTMIECMKKFLKYLNHSRSHSKTLGRYSICFYHKKFGINAHKCIMPCSSNKKLEKLNQLSSMEATDNNNNNKPLEELRLYIYDIKTNIKFLTGTGSMVSVLLWKYVSGRKKNDDYNLYAVNNTTNEIYGNKILFETLFETRTEKNM